MDNGFEYIKNLIPLKTCKELSSLLKTSFENGHTIRDGQCPFAESIYGTPYFDKLLMELKPKFEELTCKQLHPTYSFARIYKKHNILSRHVDRPACEISCSITLDWEGDHRWPLCFEKEKETCLIMDRGDAILYMGSIPHWRNPYEGVWQTQVFLHYVDANGPFAGEIYDGRPNLNIA